MQKTYITDRLLPKIITKICQQRNIHVTSFSDDWVLRLERDGLIRWIVSSQFDLNHAAASDVVGDKVACYLALHDQNVPAVEHRLMRIIVSPEIMHAEFAHFPALKPVVVKPLRGNGGRDVQRFDTPNDASNFVHKQSHPEWTISLWHDIQTETRLIILDGKVLTAYEKSSQMQNGLKMFNLSHGNNAKIITAHQDIQTLALRATEVLGLRLCAVDIITLSDGRRLVLEINDHFGMEYFARQSDKHYHTAYTVYEKIIDAMME